MIKLLLLDNRRGRRDDIVKLISEDSDIRVDAQDQVSECEIASGHYDLAIVHAGNEEANHIEDETWDVGKARVILFSGGFTKDCSEVDGMLYVSERYLMKNVLRLVYGDGCE